MRIAVDAMLLGGAHSGVEVAIEGLCRGLGEVAGRDRILVCHRPQYDSSELRMPAVTTLRAAGWARSRVGRLVWEHAVLTRVVRRWGADVLHAPGYVAPVGWSGPLVLTVYDILALTHPEWCRWSNAVHYRRALPGSIRRADVVIVPSRAVQSEIIAHLNVDARKLRVVPLGISRDMTPVGEWGIAAVRRALSLTEPYILWVGNIEPKKNLPGLVAAFEIAAQRIPHELVLAGRAGWRAGPSLRAIAESPLQPRIRLLGRVPESLLPGLYSGADLLVHWSLYEGAGLTPLEAMACGTPAIVSDAGALPELAGRVAPVVPLGDLERLAAEMVNLVTDRERHAALQRAGRELARGFSWPEHARAALAVYREVCEAEE